jgi:hypothetical protein
MTPRFETRTKIAEADFGGTTYTLAAEAFFMGISKEGANGEIELRIFDTPDWRNLSVSPLTWANIHIGSTTLSKDPAELVSAAVDKLNKGLAEKLDGQDPDGGSDLGLAEQFIRQIEKLVMGLGFLSGENLRVKSETEE